MSAPGVIPMLRSHPCIVVLRWVLLLLTIALVPPLPAQESDTAAAPAEEPDDPILAQALTPWTGDLDGILKRGLLRVAIPYGLTTYFMDGPETWTSRRSICRSPTSMPA